MSLPKFLSKKSYTGTAAAPAVAPATTLPASTAAIGSILPFNTLSAEVAPAFKTPLVNFILLPIPGTFSIASAS